MVYRPHTNKKLCFALMPFGDPFDGYYKDIIQPGIRAAGLEPLRSDEIYGTQPIIRDIWRSIWKARLIVADVTGKNPNVNYELGLCHALGIPTVILTKDMSDVPFDYRHRRCILYRAEKAKWDQKLQEDLTKTIHSVLDGEGSADELLQWPYETDPNRTGAVVAGQLTVESSEDLVIRGAGLLHSDLRKAIGPHGAKLSRVDFHDVAFSQGSKIAETVKSPNPFEEAGIALMRKVAHETVAAGGDFSKLAVILSYALTSRGKEAIDRGFLPKDIVFGMEKAVDAAVRSIAQNKGQADDLSLTQVATTSACDHDVGSLVSQAIVEAGGFGQVIVHDASDERAKVKVVEGMQFGYGYSSQHFITDKHENLCVLDDCRILIYDRKISSLIEIVPVMESVVRARGQLLVIAEDVDGEALATLVSNHIRGTLKCAAVRVPTLRYRSESLVGDLAAFTGATAISDELGLSLVNVSLDQLGSAKQARVSRDSTTILGGHGSREAIDARIQLVQSDLTNTWDESLKLGLRRRLANLAGKLVVLIPGGTTPSDRVHERYKMESAVESVQGALAGGVVFGGGRAFLEAQEALAFSPQASEPEKAGIAVVRDALEEPTKALAENAGLSGVEVLAEIRKSGRRSVGFDALSKNVTDLRAAGVLDSAHGITSALLIAFSYARQILETGRWDLNVQESAASSSDLPGLPARQE